MRTKSLKGDETKDKKRSLLETITGLEKDEVSVDIQSKEQDLESMEV